MEPLPMLVQAEDSRPQIETQDGKVDRVIVPGNEEPVTETRQGNQINLDYDHQAQNSQETVHSDEGE
jgi:hypothetical protein